MEVYNSNLNCWLFKWFQVSWTRKRTVFGKVSPKVWARGKSGQKGCQDFWMSSTTSRSLKSSSSVFKLKQTCFVKGSVELRHGFSSTTRKPSAKAISRSVRRHRDRGKQDSQKSNHVYVHYDNTLAEDAPELPAV